MNIPCFFCTYWQPSTFNNDTNTYSDASAPCLMHPGMQKGKFDRCDNGRLLIPNTGGNDESIADVSTAATKQAGTSVRQKHTVSVSHGTHIDIGESGDVTLYQHQREVVNKFKDKREGSLFMEIGTGKS